MERETRIFFRAKILALRLSGARPLLVVLSQQLSGTKCRQAMALFGRRSWLCCFPFFLRLFLLLFLLDSFILFFILTIPRCNGGVSAFGPGALPRSAEDHPIG